MNAKKEAEQRFYNAAAWRRLRIVALQRDHYLCQHCAGRGRVTPATEVHHKQALEQYPEQSLELNNLVSLCHACHDETKHFGHTADTPAGVRIIQA